MMTWQKSRKSFKKFLNGRGWEVSVLVRNRLPGPRRYRIFKPMNQREFDLDLLCPDEDWQNPEDGFGWRNNPIAQLFDQHRQTSVRGQHWDEDFPCRPDDTVLKRRGRD